MSASSAVIFVPLFVVNYTQSGLVPTAALKAFVSQTEATAFQTATSGATMQPSMGVALCQAGSSPSQVFLVSTTAVPLSGTTAFSPYLGR